MKIQSIRLHPFAGIVDKTYEFSDGLTVICGPNEEGKSTIFRAIQQALFLDSNLTAAKRKDHLKNVMPLSGSDTIRVTLKFSQNEALFTLEKQWGANASSTLSGSDGVSFTDNASVQKHILEMLPANQAVVEQILIASQSKLANAVSDLSSDVQVSLSEQLRGAVINGGGISASRLQETITEIVNKYFGRWDSESNRPEGGPGRGLQNPWVNGLGFIADAWYKSENAKKIAQETIFFETESSRLQSLLNQCNGELNTFDSFLKANDDAYNAINRRISIEGDIRQYQTELDRFTADANRWPVATSELDSARTASNTVKTELKDLKSELTNARRKLSSQQDVKKLEQVKALGMQIDQLHLEIGALLKVEENDLSLAEQAQRKISNCQSLIEGQKLSFVVEPEVSGDIEIIHGTGERQAFHFEPGVKFTKDIRGGIRFDWKGVHFTIQSANEDISALETSIRNAHASIETIFKKYHQTDINGLQALSKKYRDTHQNLDLLNSKLEAGLGDDSIEILTARCEEAKALPGTRDINVLEALEREKNQSDGRYSASIDTIDKEINTLIEKHETREKLDATRLDLIHSKKEKESQLTQLPPLPNDYKSATSFQAYYINIQNQKEEKIGLKHEYEISLNNLSQPPFTLPEIREQSSFASSRFKQILAEGKAFQVVQKRLNEIITKADESAFAPLHTKTNTYLNRLSNGRFTHIPFEATQPQTLTGDGVAIPVSLLSKGTKDILALALRLAAAEVYLENNSGFVIMDDPLVDMDRQRREASAKVLQEFSKEHQTIIFTCHDAHAELLTRAQAKSNL